jgi:hypothetical protein
VGLERFNHALLTGLLQPPISAITSADLTRAILFSEEQRNSTTWSSSSFSVSISRMSDTCSSPRWARGSRSIMSRRRGFRPAHDPVIRQASTA